MSNYKIASYKIELLQEFINENDIKWSILMSDGRFNSSILKNLKTSQFLIDNTSYLTGDVSLLIRKFYYFYDISVQAKCLTCNKFLISEPYKKYCSNLCARNNSIEKLKTAISKSKINLITGKTASQTAGVKSSIRRMIIDPATGKTIGKLAGEKGSITRTMIDPITNLSPAQSGSIKSASIRNKIDPITGKSNYQVTNEKEGAKRFNQNLKWKLEFEKYVTLVGRLTKKIIANNSHLIENIDLRGHVKNNINCYHVDHIVSVKDGFRNNIHPIIIASLPNLRCIPWKENVVKHDKSAMIHDDLFDKFLAWRLSAI